MKSKAKQRKEIAKEKKKEGGEGKKGIKYTPIFTGNPISGITSTNF